MRTAWANTSLTPLWHSAVTTHSTYPQENYNMYVVNPLDIFDVPNRVHFFAHPKQMGVPLVLSPQLLCCPCECLHSIRLDSYPYPLKEERIHIPSYAYY